jgi:phenylacetate-CoA ligase
MMMADRRTHGGVKRTGGTRVSGSGTLRNGVRSFVQQRLYYMLPVSFQNAMITRHGRRIREERFGPDFERASAFLAESEWRSRDELRAYQDERLAVIVRHAYETVPYYRDVMDRLGLKPADIARVGDLPKLPILTRDELTANFDKLLSTSVKKSDLRLVSTSGTTGSLLHAYWDRAVDVMNNACLWRGRRWAGFEFGRPYATLLARSLVSRSQTRPPFWRYNRSWNQLFLSPIHLTDEFIPYYIDELRRWQVEALDAYPSSSYIVARFLESRGEHLPLSCVFTTGEPLLQPERELIEERFCCRVFDGYSQAERVMYSSECDHHSGHHVYSEYGVTELVDDEAMPVPDGSVGLIVATGLHNFAMPLLRYAVGDTASLAAEPCECGRGLPLLRDVATRADDIVVTPDGRLVPPLTLQLAFRQVPGIMRSQIVQNEPGEITARLMVKAPLRPQDESRLRHNIAERLGPAVAVRIEYVDDIPYSGRCKYRRVISTVPLTWGNTRTANLYQHEPTDAPQGDRGGGERRG